MVQLSVIEKNPILFGKQTSLAYLLEQQNDIAQSNDLFFQMIGRKKKTFHLYPQKTIANILSIVSK
jgi:hypothetical protein